MDNLFQQICNQFTSNNLGEDEEYQEPSAAGQTGSNFSEATTGEL